MSVVFTSTLDLGLFAPKAGEADFGDVSGMTNWQIIIEMLTGSKN